MLGRRSQSYDFGSVRTVRNGVPSPFADLYYSIMEMGWAAFVGFVCLAFAIINLGFGLVYTAMPGAIANARPGSLIDGVFFSIDTLGTVGYGFMYPATHIAHAIAAIEILLGLFFSATITGLIFARFARPRVGLAFSNSMVIGQYEGQRALMLRVVSIRSRPLADADAQISWLETRRHEDGSIYRRLAELELVRNRNPMLGLAWTVVHLLDDDSPVIAALDGDEPFLITALVRGTDTLLASPTIGNYRYGRDDVRRDHEFVDMLITRDDVMMLEMDRLHGTRSIDREAV
ncbi:ion channel [Sphingomonas bacterium]|uniref:ion channel n=1 Tax=Sphingomonas bacterium TaxID=1895847 RepID=UPI0015757A06|nr:ion channel [Sphingomonas bacterium]